MKIAMRRGHQRTGSDGCASGIVNEITVADDYYKKAMHEFKAMGHNVLDCTPPEANRSLSDSLWYGVNKANKWGADIFISCHANNAYNSYNGSIGCEVIYHRNSTKGKNYAIKIEKELSNIGFKSRGAKSDVRNLCEINNTNMPCVIIEPFFVEATGDVATYRRVGGQGIANCIVKGVTGKLPSNNSKPNNKEENKKMDIVLYFGEVDKYGANYVSDYLKLPLLSLKYFNENAHVKNNANKVYLVGGSEKNKPTSNTVLIAGNGRYDTANEVSKFIRK